MFSGSSPARTKRSPGSAPTTPISKCFAVRKRSHRDEHGILPAKSMKMKGIDTADLQTSPSPSASPLGHVALPFRKQTISLGLGSFNVFSNCLLVTFIETIDVPALIVLCQTSREWQKRITKFVLTKNGQNLMMQRCEQSPKGERYTNNDVFHLYGKLLKALTMGQHNSKRIDFLFEVCKPLFDSPLASGLGRIIRTYCHGLPMLFTIRVLNALMKRECRKLDSEISLILEDEVGAHPQIELKVRKTLHDLLVDAAYGTEEGKLEDAFWLSVLLRTRNAISDQAKLLMLLFAPITKMDTPFGVGSSEQIDWRSLCDHVVVSWEDGIDRIRPIADALDTLTHAVKINHSLYHWNKLQIFNLIEETTTFPEPWAFDNFVFLLMFKPTILAPISLSARMTYNFEDEAGQIICTMKSLLFRWNMDMPIFLLPVLMATVAELPLEPTDKKREFIAVILKAQGKLAGELLMSGIPGEHMDFVEELAAFKMMINVLMPAVNGI